MPVATVPRRFDGERIQLRRAISTTRTSQRTSGPAPLSRAGAARCVAALILLLAPACRNAEDSIPHGLAPGLSPALLAPEEAMDVRSEVLPDIQRLEFTLKTPYPSSGTILELARHLEAAGWTPTRNNWFNRGEESGYVRGWTEYVAASGPDEPERFVCLWWAHWIGPHGELLDYSLTYLSQDSSPTNSTGLTVRAWLIPPEAAKELEKSQNIGRGQPLELVPRGTPPTTGMATAESVFLGAKLHRSRQERQAAGS